MRSIAVLAAVRHYTPSPVAEALVSALPHSEERTWLEPCVGGGVFLEALAALGVGRERITAIDLDPRPKKMQQLARLHNGRDFIGWASETRSRFDNVVGNPPYITLERVPSRLREVAYSVECEGLGAVPRGANYWLAFLYASVNLLKTGGAIGFVLPAAYEYADYAAPWRKWLRANFRDSLTLRSRERVFAKVQDGSVFLVASGFKQRGGEHRVARCEFAADVPSKLEAREGAQAKTPPARLASKFAVVPWADVFDLRIGAVTGNNAQFIFSDEQRQEHQLPKSACVPMVTRARHIRGAEVAKRDWLTLLNAGEPVWMFRPRTSQLRDVAVARYLDAIDTEKKNFKVMDRAVWHRVDLPHRPQGFISGMAIHGPWICLSRLRGLHATNTLYTVRFERARNLEEKARDALSLLTTFVREQISDVARVYPDGLMKMEPRDLRALVLPVVDTSVGALDVYRRAITHLADGQTRKAMKLADSWFEDRC